MDIVNNVLQAPVVAQPVAPYGYSKYAKSYLDVLKTNLDENIARVNAQNQVVKTYVENVETTATTDRAAIRSELAAEVSTATTDRAAIRSELAAEVSSRASEITRIEGLITAAGNAASGDNTALAQRVTDLETWKAENIDELLGQEIDKAINEKVNQTAYDAVVAQLESADNALTQSIATAIADRDAVDDKIKTFITMLMETYHLEDASGNVITSLDDVVVPT